MSGVHLVLDQISSVTTTTVSHDYRFTTDGGVLVMEHMDAEDDTPVDPFEAGELALKRPDEGVPTYRAN